MKINGFDLQQLTTEGVNLDPAYSSDGLHIWFSSNRSVIENFEIWSMNTDGTVQTQLTNNTAADTRPWAVTSGAAPRRPRSSKFVAFVETWFNRGTYNV